jgi:phospholipase C
VWNTALLIGWDEPGGTYDHVPPGTVVPPDPAAPPGECGFAFDRSGYRVPAVIVSPWVESGSVYNEEYRHTSLIATLREAWDLGEPLTRRDASARTFGHVFSRPTPRHPDSWADVVPHPVPAWTLDVKKVGKGLSAVGKGMGATLIAKCREMEIALPAELDDADTELPPGLIVQFLRDVAHHFFPLLTEKAERSQAPTSQD